MKRMGRPPKPPSQRKGAPLTFWLTAAQRRELLRMAKRAEVGIGTYVRQVLEQHVAQGRA